MLFGRQKFRINQQLKSFTGHFQSSSSGMEQNLKRQKLIIWNEQKFTKKARHSDKGLLEVHKMTMTSMQIK